MNTRVYNNQKGVNIVIKILQKIIVHEKLIPDLKLFY